jgi:Calcineurin-like phosphoesterase
MRLAIVHLSDLHIRTADSPLLSRANQIADAISSVTPEKLQVLLAWTGDIAFSGKAEEYKLATSLIEGVESALKSRATVQLLGSLFVPGNHDCDFALSGDARSPLLDSLPVHIDQLDPCGEMVHQITRPQEAFFSFLASRGIHTDNRLIWQKTFDATQTQVLVRCCNTAWTSQLPEKATLLFPSHAIKESPCPLTITLLHHPFSWFDPTNGKAVRRKFEIDSDLILTGHEHDPDAFARSGLDSSTQYLEAGALAAANVQTGFSISLVDMPGATIQMFSFAWLDPIYSRSVETQFPFIRKQRAIVNRFIRTAEFEKTVEEVTTPFSHPRKELRLSDIYVQPPLTQIIYGNSGKTSEQVIPAEGVMDFILAEKLVRISAPTGYGKSALARVLCRDLLDLRSMVPVYLDPSLISGHDTNRVAKSIEKAFSKEYGSHLLEYFRQLGTATRVLIFDDWDRLRFNENGRKHLLKSLASCADYVVIFDDATSFIQQLTDLTLRDDIPRPKLCELRQFGYRHRGALIERWHRVGRAFEVSEGTLAHDISVSEHLLDALIARGVTPSTPLFMLSALQMQQEAANSGGDYGSFGHIYQSLITRRLSKQSSKQIALKLNFLSMLAFKLFETQLDSLTLVQIKETGRAYEEEYGYEFEPRSLLKEIAESGLIQFDGDTFKFEYRYVYYYSVAYAFRTNVANEQTRTGARNQLTRLAKEAYFDDNANILIFYIYLSKDRGLMEEVLANASSIFVNIDPCNLESDIDFVNKLLSAPPTLEEPSEDLSQNQLEHRIARDEAIANQLPAASEEDSLNEISEVNFAIRSLEIMGQILKNFPSDLRRDIKLSLAKESYALGLRSMGSLLRTLQGNRNTIRDVMAANLAKETAFAGKTLSKQQAMLDGIIVFFAQLGIYGILKKISGSMGTEDLRHTYDEVRSEMGESRVATRLIDLSIRLDHFGSLPESDILDLEKRLRGNTAAWTILGMLVAEHVALFPTNWRTRQRLVDLFRFSRTTGLPSPKQLLPSGR